MANMASIWPIWHFLGAINGIGHSENRASWSILLPPFGLATSSRSIGPPIVCCSWSLVMMGTVVPAYYLSTQVDKYFIYIRSPSCTGFVANKSQPEASMHHWQMIILRWVVPRLGDGKCSRTGHNSVIFKVGFISHDHYWNVLIILDSDDLLPKFSKLRETGQACDRKDE